MAEQTGMIRKWVGLTAGIIIQALAGSGVCFPNYSPFLKSVMQLSQVQLNNIGVAKEFGENVGLLAGFVCNLLPPWALLLIGAAEGFIGYGILFLVLSGRIAPLHYWQMASLFCLAANSSTWYNAAVLVTSMRNFSQSRGTVVGIVKGFLGLSGAIFTQIYIVLLSQDPSSFVLLLALAPLAVVVFTMYFVQPVSSPTGNHDPKEPAAFFFIHIICIVLAVFLLVVSLTESVFALTHLWGRILIAVLCMLLFSPLAVPAKLLLDKYFRGGRKVFRMFNNGTKEPLLAGIGPEMVHEEGKSDKSAAKEDEQGLRARSQQQEEEARVEKSSSMCLYPSPDLEGEEDSQTMLALGEGAVQRKKGPTRGEDFTLTEALVKADFWLLFFILFCAVGTGNTVVNNLGQIGQAQGYGNVTLFVSLFSICNFCGRLSGGTLSEYYVRLFARPRTAVMMVAQVLMIIGHSLFATAVSGSLLIGSVFLGFSCGVHYTVMVPTVSELFGLRDFGMIHNFMALGAPVASVLFSGVIAGYFYDKEAAKFGGVCEGSHCFRTTFFIMAAVCFLALLANVLLTLRITPVYQTLYGVSLPRAKHSSYESLSLAADKGMIHRPPRLSSSPNSSGSIH